MRSKDACVLAEDFFSHVHVEMSPKPEDGISGASKLTFSLKIFFGVSMLNFTETKGRHKRGKESHVLAEGSSRVHVEMLPKPKDGIGGAMKLTFSLKDLHMSMLKCYRNLRTAYAGQGQLLSR